MKKKKIITLITIIIITITNLFCLFGCKNNAIENNDVIGIIGAMDVEVASLKAEMKNVEIDTFANKEYHIGLLGNTKVVVVKCDMGKVNAAICANTLINKYGCTKIINTGIGGALDRKLKKGDIVISLDAVQHDFDATPIGYEKGEIPYTKKVSFNADEDLINKAYEAATEYNKNVNIHKGRICTGDQFIDTNEGKEKITLDFGGLCCDMESGAIAQACYLNNVPFVILRAVSDVPGETEIDEYKATEEDISISCAKVVEYMVKNKF